MAEKTRRVLAIEGARIGFKNFRGEKDEVNKSGNRTCVVYISDFAFAEELADEGWNIKFPDQPEGHDSDERVRHPYLSLTARYDNFPPKIYMIEETTQTKELLNEETVSLLDTTELETVDLMITPYHYTANGNTGVKAYIKEMYAVMVPSPFFAKYNW